MEGFQLISLYTNINERIIEIIKFRKSSGLLD